MVDYPCGCLIISDYKRYTLGKEFINNDLSDALLSEVENDEKDEL